MQGLMLVGVLFIAFFSFIVLGTNDLLRFTDVNFRVLTYQSRFSVAQKNQSLNQKLEDLLIN